MSTSKVDPDTLALRAAPQPVTRLNRRVLAAGIGLLSAAILGATLWSLNAERKQRQIQQPELRNTERVARAEGLERLPQTYSDVPVLGPPQPGDWGAPLLHAQQKADAAPSTELPPDHQRATQLDRQRGAEQIANSPVLFRTGGPTSAATVDQSARAPAPSIALPNGFGFPVGQQATDPTVAQNQQEHKQKFLDQTNALQTRASGELQPPPSPYAVMAGTVIAAALWSGIKSDLPGDIIANVTEPVYDSATGRYLLVPQGSRLMGRYDSQISFGQRRVMVVWTRLILPDTSSITLDRLPGVDPAGYAGLEDGVDWHWDRIFAGAAVSTLIGVGAEMASPDRSNSEGRVIVATRESMQDTVNQVGQEITKRNLSIQPTLTERPGLPLRVIVNRDLVLRPYQPLIFERTAL